MHLLDSLGRNKHFKYVVNLHEQACAIAADAYAQYTGDIGIALLTTGPGASNAVTGVAAAWIDSTPLLILSGQVKTSDLRHRHGVRQMGVQELDTVALVSPVCKYAKCVTDPQQIKFELQKALHMARSGRPGPVWLDLPLDLQAANIDPEQLPDYEPAQQAPQDCRRAAEQIMKAINQADKPVFYAGNGIRLAKVIPEFRMLAEKLHMPVLTSWKAADFLPEDHPCFVGRPGIIPQRAANIIQQSADCLIALGTRLDLCQTGFRHDNFAPKAKKYIVDVDDKELNKLEMPLSGRYALHLAPLLKEMLTLAEKTAPASQAWLAHCKKLQQRYPVFQESYRRPISPGISLYHLIEELSKHADPEAIIVPGSSGACAEVTLQAFKIKDGQRLLNSPGLGSMGFGLAAAIGVSVATGSKRRIIGIIGDGGLQHNLQEMQTWIRLRLPICLFVLNNNGYGSIYQMQKNRFQGNFVACHPESGLTLPSLAALSQAYGLPYEKIANTQDLESKLPVLLAENGPRLCEVMLCAEQETLPRLTSKMLPDGKMITERMENVYPFLSAEELQNCLEGD